MAETNEVTQTEQPPTKDMCTWAMICHLAGLAWAVIPGIGGVIASLIIWQMKKDLHPFVNQSGKEAINFQISMLIYGAIALLLCFIGIGVFLLPIVAIVDLILAIIAGIKAADGKAYRYPLTIRFIT